MNILLSRILKYLNGTLFLDDAYRFCVFFIENYIDFYKMTKLWRLFVRRSCKRIKDNTRKYFKLFKIFRFL